jgi:hypothetical protein
MKLSFLFWIFHLFSLNFASKSSTLDGSQIHLNQPYKQLKPNDFSEKNLATKIVHPSLSETEQAQTVYSDKEAVASNVVPETTIYVRFNKLLRESISGALKINWLHVGAFLKTKYSKEGEFKNYIFKYQKKVVSLPPRGIIIFNFLKEDFKTFKKEFPTLSKEYVLHNFTFRILSKYGFTARSFLNFLDMESKIDKSETRMTKSFHFTRFFGELCSNLLERRVNNLFQLGDTPNRFKYQKDYFFILSLLYDIVNEKSFKEFTAFRLRKALETALKLNHLEFKNRLDVYSQLRCFEEEWIDPVFFPLFRDLNEIYRLAYYPLGDVADKNALDFVKFKPIGKLVAEIIKHETGITYLKFLTEKLGLEIPIDIDIENTDNIAKPLFEYLKKELNLQDNDPILKDLHPLPDNGSLFTSMQGQFILLFVYHENFRGIEGPFNTEEFNKESDSYKFGSKSLKSSKKAKDTKKNPKNSVNRVNDNIQSPQITNNLIDDSQNLLENSVLQSSQTVTFGACNPFEELIMTSISKALRFDHKKMITALDKVGRKHSSISEDETKLFEFLKNRFLVFKQNERKRNNYHKFTKQVLEEFEFTVVDFLQYLGFETKNPDPNNSSCPLASLFYKQIFRLFQKSFIGDSEFLQQQKSREELVKKLEIIESRPEKGKAGYFRKSGGYIITLSLLNDIINGKEFKKLKPIGNDNQHVQVPLDLKAAFEEALDLDHINFKKCLDEFCKTENFNETLNESKFNSFLKVFKDIYREVYYKASLEFTDTTLRKERMTLISDLVRNIITYELNISFAEFLKSLGFLIPPNDPHVETNGYAHVVFSGLEKMFDVKLLEGLKPQGRIHFNTMRGPFILGFVYHKIFREEKARPMAIKSLKNLETQLQDNLEISPADILEDIKAIEISKISAIKDLRKPRNATSTSQVKTKVKGIESHNNQHFNIQISPENSLETQSQANLFVSPEKLEPKLPKNIKRSLSESAVNPVQTKKKTPKVVNDCKDIKKSETSPSTLEVCSPFEELLQASILKALEFDLKGMSYSLNISVIRSSAPEDEKKFFEFLKNFYVPFVELDLKNKGNFHKFTFLVLEECKFTDAGFLEYLGFRSKDPNSKARSVQFAKSFCLKVKELFLKTSKNPELIAPTDFTILEWQDELRGKAKFFKSFCGDFLILSLLNDIVNGKEFQRIKPISKLQSSSKAQGPDNDPLCSSGPKKTFEVALELDHNTFKRALHEYCRTKKFNGVLNGPNFKSFFDQFKDIYCEVYFPKSLKYTYKTWTGEKILPLSDLVCEIITYELDIPFEKFLKSLGFIIPPNYMDYEGKGYAPIIYDGLKEWFDIELLKGLDPRKTTHFHTMRGPFMLAYVYFQDFRKKEAGRMRTKECKNPGSSLPNDLEISQSEFLENSDTSGSEAVEISKKIGTKIAKKPKHKRSLSKVPKSKQSKRSSLKVESKKRKVTKLDNQDISKQIDVEESIDSFDQSNCCIDPENLEPRSPKHLKRFPSESLVESDLARTKAFEIDNDIELKDLKNSASRSSGNSRERSENESEIENLMNKDVNWKSEKEKVSPANIEALHELNYNLNLGIQKILQSQNENTYLNCPPNNPNSQESATNQLNKPKAKNCKELDFIFPRPSNMNLNSNCQPKEDLKRRKRKLNNEDSSDEIQIQYSPIKFENILTEQSPKSFEPPKSDKDLKSNEHRDDIEDPVYLPPKTTINSTEEHSNYSNIYEYPDEYNQKKVVGIKSYMDLLYTQIPIHGEESFETQVGSNESLLNWSIDVTNSQDLQSNSSVNSIEAIQPALDIQDEIPNPPQSEPFRDNTNVNLLLNYDTSLKTVGGENDFEIEDFMNKVLNTEFEEEKVSPANSTNNSNESTASHFRDIEKDQYIHFTKGFENLIVSQSNPAVGQRQDNQESFENAFTSSWDLLDEGIEKFDETFTTF